HQAFKSHRLVGVAGNIVTVAVEAYNPDGSTTEMEGEHRLDPPNGVVATMTGGHFDGARFTHSYTPLGGRPKVDGARGFPGLPGAAEADEPGMTDGFFATVCGEDSETRRTWSPTE